RGAFALRGAEATFACPRHHLGLLLPFSPSHPKRKREPRRGAGGDLLTTNLRALAKDRGLSVVVVDAKWRPHRVYGTVFVGEGYGRGSKEDRRSRSQRRTSAGASHTFAVWTSRRSRTRLRHGSQRRVNGLRIGSTVLYTRSASCSDFHSTSPIAEPHSTESR